jgi:hypothetical protein
VVGSGRGGCGSGNGWVAGWQWLFGSDSGKVVVAVAVAGWWWRSGSGSALGGGGYLAVAVAGWQWLFGDI